MSSENADTEQKIAALVKSARITPDEGRRLRDALPGGRPRAPAWRLAIDPWAQLSPEATLALALVISAGSVALSVAFDQDLRFDGAFDLHLAEGPVSLTTALVDQFLAWPATALVFHAVARLFRARVRLVDTVALIGASRAPLFFFAVALALFPLPPAGAFTPKGLLMVAVLALPLVFYQFVVSYFAWRHLTGLGAPRVGLGFAAAVVIAEAATKLVLLAL